MPSCPWIPSHDVSPAPDGLDVGDVGTDLRCGLQYVVRAVNPYRLARDEEGSAAALRALATRRKIPLAVYQELLAHPKVAKALRARGLAPPRDGRRGRGND